LREKIGPTRIAIVLRRQDKFANSYMNQLVKAKRVSFEAICQFEDTITDYDPHFDYQATLNQMGEISGEVRCTIYLIPLDLRMICAIPSA
jgi:hypothetical protein